MPFPFLSRRVGSLPPGSVLALFLVVPAFGFPLARIAHAQTTYTYKGNSGTTGAPSDGTFFTGFNGYSNGLPKTNGSYGANDATFVFGGTSTYTATDDLTSSLALNVLQFTNSAVSTEKVTLARGGVATRCKVSKTNTTGWVLKPMAIGCGPWDTFTVLHDGGAPTVIKSAGRYKPSGNGLK